MWVKIVCGWVWILFVILLFVMVWFFFRIMWLMIGFFWIWMVMSLLLFWIWILENRLVVNRVWMDRLIVWLFVY